MDVLDCVPCTAVLIRDAAGDGLAAELPFPESGVVTEECFGSVKLRPPAAYVWRVGKS